ncbi:MAG: EamA family transporter, partial [Oscillospiraceae bacterium]
FRAMEVSAFYASMSFFLKPAIAPFAAFWINGIAPSTQIFVALALVMGGSLLCITEPKTPIQQK